MKDKNMKNIKIGSDIHHCLKILAAQNNRGIYELVETLLLQGMKQIVLNQTRKGVLPKGSLISRLVQAAEKNQSVPQNERRGSRARS
jgi:hypothetical protein